MIVHVKSVYQLLHLIKISTSNVPNSNHSIFPNHSLKFNDDPNTTYYFTLPHPSGVFCVTNLNFMVSLNTHLNFFILFILFDKNYNSDKIQLPAYSSAAPIQLNKAREKLINNHIDCPYLSSCSQVSSRSLMLHKKSNLG